MKTRTQLALLVSLSALFVLPASARIVIGEGNVSCRAWTKERQSNSVRSRLQETWLLGYVTGYSWGDKSRPDFLFAANIDGMFKWVDEYCRLNPQNDLVNAADELVGVLLKKAETPL